MTIMLHLPEDGGIDSKALALSFKAILDRCCDGLPVKRQYWDLTADQFDRTLLWQFPPYEMGDWNALIEGYLSDWLMLHAALILGTPNASATSDRDRTINASAIFAASARGLTVPKIENERTIWINIPGHIWSKIDSMALVQLIGSILLPYSGTYDMNV